MIVGLAADLGLAAVGIALLLNLWRLWLGPDTVARVLALDTIVINAIALVVLLGIRFGTAMYFEAALVMAMLGFVSTVAFCKFMLRGNVIE